MYKTIKRVRGVGFSKPNLTPQQVMAGTKKVRSYDEWEDLLNGELGEKLDLPKF